MATKKRKRPKPKTLGKMGDAPVRKDLHTLVLEAEGAFALKLEKRRSHGRKDP